jgi:rfaE bifunctional protein nucleotidyltransferase chain/domain
MILSREDAVAWVHRARARGRQIVFTNGVFDLLHPGHVRYLQEARRLGDVLIVAVNSDRSARVLDKGSGRPLNPESERGEVLAALACVDAVTIFEGDTPHDIVAALQPDILVKGADWGPDNIVGRDIVEARGGQVVRIPVVEGYSTTQLIAKVRENQEKQPDSRFLKPET